MAGRAARVVLTCLMLVAGACALETENQYVSSEDGRLSFRVPHEFTPVPVEPQGLEWVAGLDASPQPVADHARSFVLDHPFVLAQVVDLAPEVRAGLSHEMLRTFALEDRRDPLDDHDDIGVSFYQPLLDDRGFEGHRIEFDIELDEGTATEAQLVAISPDRSTLHRVRVVCSAECFAQHRGTIDDILDSVAVDS